jgi:hypothetical protein
MRDMLQYTQIIGSSVTFVLVARGSMNLARKGDQAWEFESWQSCQAPNLRKRQIIPHSQKWQQKKRCHFCNLTQ